MFLVAAMTTSVVGASYASSEDVGITVSAAPTGACNTAQNRNHAVNLKDQCTVAVHFLDGTMRSGAQLEGIDYWVERRVGRGPWKRFVKQHVMDNNGVTEFVKFQARSTAEYRVAFNTGGQAAFADLYTDSFTIYAN